MPQLITLSKLATLVSENTGIEFAICEAFIRNMAQTTASGLIEGEHIRIKDFGLFEPRHSVDGTINVEFVPETPFAERVNAPFAHLRPSEVFKKSATQQPETPAYAQQQPAMPQTPAYPQQPAMPQTPAYPQQPERPAYAQQQPTMPQTPSYPQQPETPAYAQQQPTMPQTPSYPQQPETPAYAQQQPAMPQTPFYPQQLETPDLPSYLNLPSLEQAETESQNVQTPDTFSSDTSLGANRQLPQLSTNKKYVLIGVLGLLAGFVLGYLTGRYSSASQQEQPSSTEETAEATHNVTIPTAEQEYDYNAALSIANIDTLEEDNETLDAPEAEPKPQIVTEKVQKGQRLSDIALKHYGKKEFWVYIYLENRESISNPFTVREGAMLRIPPKDKYAPTTDEATNLAWAKSKAAEINNKYIN